MGGANQEGGGTRAKDNDEADDGTDSGGEGAQQLKDKQCARSWRLPVWGEEKRGRLGLTLWSSEPRLE